MSTSTTIICICLVTIIHQVYCESVENDGLNTNHTNDDKLLFAHTVSTIIL